MNVENPDNLVTTTVPVIKGRAYNGIRLKLSQALHALDIAEVSRSLATADFSRLYRSLPVGGNIQLTVFLHNGQFRLNCDVTISAAMADHLALGIRYLKSSKIAVSGSGSTRLELWHDYKVTARSNFSRAAEILSAKTSQEVEYEAQVANEELGAARVSLQSFAEDLQAAADIQSHMLLSNKKLKELSPQLDCHSYIIPCKDIGGDLYDCISLGNSCYALAIGDVSGKGVPAALMMATCTTLIRAYSESSLSPAAIIHKINQRLFEGNEEDCMFTTLCLIIVNCNESHLAYCNAGHNPSILRRADGSVSSLDVVHGPALGIFEGHRYSESNVCLGLGDSLLMYTDGLSEAFNRQGEIYGHERILSYCRRTSLEVGSRRFLGGLLLDNNIFSGGRHAHDDVTMLAVRRLKPPASLQLQVSASHGECLLVKSRIESCCQEWRIPTATTARVLLALDELLGNVLMHANDDDVAALRIEVRISRYTNFLRLDIKDSGPPFNPLEAPVPDTEQDLESRPIGGLGLFLAKSISDSFSYVYSPPWNCVSLDVPCALEGRL
jgi:phosphoserine phosphatase RsbU/P